MVLRRWESITGYTLVLSTELITKMATVKSLKADVTSVSPSSERKVSNYTLSTPLMHASYAFLMLGKIRRCLEKAKTNIIYSM